MFSIRPLIKADEPFLWEMLYQAIFVEEGQPSPPRDILAQPELAKYVAEWGKDGDDGFIAIDEQTSKPVGAVWLRLFSGDAKGYGYVADDVPELSMALLPEYRGQGIGSKLMVQMLDYASSKYSSVSLSVSRNNPALRLYERFGFRPVGTNGTSITMQHIFNKSQTGM
jgi:ribosomal protein S18 acetylase RimI-like enzyme